MTIRMLAAGAALLAASAAADPLATSAPIERVSYTDLDLGSQAGRTLLERRIRTAAGHVCLRGEVDGPDHYFLRLEQAKCFSAAVKDGLGQMQDIIAARASRSVIAAVGLTVRKQ